MCASHAPTPDASSDCSAFRLPAPTNTAPLCTAVRVVSAWTVSTILRDRNAKHDDSPSNGNRGPVAAATNRHHLGHADEPDLLNTIVVARIIGIWRIEQAPPMFTQLVIKHTPPGWVGNAVDNPRLSSSRGAVEPYRAPPDTSQRQAWNTCRNVLVSSTE